MGKNLLFSIVYILIYSLPNLSYNDNSICRHIINRFGLSVVAGIEQEELSVFQKESI